MLAGLAIIGTANAIQIPRGFNGEALVQKCDNQLVQSQARAESLAEKLTLDDDNDEGDQEKWEEDLKNKSKNSGDEKEARGEIQDYVRSKTSMDDDVKMLREHFKEMNFPDLRKQADDDNRRREGDNDVKWPNNNDHHNDYDDHHDDDSDDDSDDDRDNK